MESRDTSISLPGTVQLENAEEFIEDLGWFAAINLRVLSDVLITLQLQAQGHRLVYGLDFDIIYAYAFPWSRDSYNSALATLLIEEDSVPIVLLPGTVEELFQFMVDPAERRHVIREFEEALRRYEANELTLRAGKSLGHRARLGRAGPSAKTDLKSLAMGMVDTKQIVDFGMKRIDRLLHSNRLLNPKTVFGESEAQLYDDANVRTIQNRLAAREWRSQKEKDRRNHMDGKNLAAVARHSEVQHVASRRNEYRGYMLRLLTNTRCILEDDFREYDKWLLQFISRSLTGTLDHIKHSFGVRSCIEAAYAFEMFRSCNGSPSASRDFAADILIRLQEVELFSNKVYLTLDRRYASPRGFADIERMGEFFATYGRDMTLQFLRNPWYNKIRDLITYNARDQENKQFVTKEEEPWWLDSLKIEKQMMDQREVLEKHQLAKVELKSVDPGTMSVLEIFGLEGREVPLDGAGAPTRWKIEEVYSKDAEEVFTLDAFDGLYYATWPCVLSESQVLDYLNRLFCADSELSLKPFVRDGSIHVSFIGEDEECELCKLPLEFRLDETSYGRLLSSLSHGKYLNQVPGAFLCDTESCDITFAIMTPGRDDGITVAFKESWAIPRVADLFISTSRWRGWQYRDSLRDYVTDNLIRRTCRNG